MKYRRMKASNVMKRKGVAISLNAQADISDLSIFLNIKKPLAKNEIRFKLKKAKQAPSNPKE